MSEPPHPCLGALLPPLFWLRTTVSDVNWGQWKETGSVPVHGSGFQKFLGQLIRNQTEKRLLDTVSGGTRLAIREGKNLNQEQWLKVRTFWLVWPWSALDMTQHSDTKLWCKTLKKSKKKKHKWSWSRLEWKRFSFCVLFCWYCSNTTKREEDENSSSVRRVWSEQLWRYALCLSHETVSPNCFHFWTALR